MGLAKFRAQRTEQKKSAIVSAASELFADRDYDSVSMAVIAKTAGVSNATLYRHYENKEHLFVDVLDALMDTFVQSLTTQDTQQTPLSIKQVTMNYAELLSDRRVIGLLRAAVSHSQNSELLRQRVAEHGKAIAVNAFDQAILSEQRLGHINVGTQLDRARSQLQGMIEHYTLTRNLLFANPLPTEPLREEIDSILQTWSARWCA